MKLFRDNQIRSIRPAFAPCSTAWPLAVALAGGVLLAICGAAGRTIAAEAAGSQDGFRRLAPGVLTVIPPNKSNDSNVRRGDIHEITRGLEGWDPNRAAGHTTLIERARDIEFSRDIWCLEFSFKPPRMIEVDVPTKDLRMQRKRVWYLVYRVRNVGGRRTLIHKDDPLQERTVGDWRTHDDEKDPLAKRKTEIVERPVRFVPHFVLESTEGLSEEEGEIRYRSYLDRVIPSAMGPIRRREDPAREFFDSASMSAAEIPPGGERWGVAMWQDVDPRIDHFSISVRGLTNAIRWREREDGKFGAELPLAAGVDHALESLKLEFWRPGHHHDLDDAEDQMHVGYAGMFERRTLGGKILEAEGRPQLIKSRPVDGLAALGLTWQDIVVPQADAGDGSELVPLEKVVLKIAAIKDPAARGRAVRAVFGDLAPGSFEQLARALAGPVDPRQDDARRKALTDIGLSPEAAGEKPLESLAKVLAALDGVTAGPARQRRAEAFFGPAAPRVASLTKELAIARTLVILEELEINRHLLPAGDGLAAFRVVRPAIDAEQDPDGRRQLLAGLFGPRGPALYEEATEMAEGIDHQWTFDYETEDVGP